MSNGTEGVETTTDRDTTSATITVAAAPAEVFDFIRRPANHAEINGDGTVKGNLAGPEVLGDGDKFGMSMRLGVPYRIRSKVVEFEENRRIAWCHIAGHRWRWTLEPAGEGYTKVTETYDQSTARVPFALRLVGYPARHETNVARSVANVAAHFAKT
jgi:hypothetical protein